MHLELPSHASTSGTSNNTSSFSADFGADFGMPPPPHGGKAASSSVGVFGALGFAAEPFDNAFDDFPAAPTSTPPKAALTTQMASSGGGDGGEDDGGERDRGKYCHRGPEAAGGREYRRHRGYAEYQ